MALRKSFPTANYGAQNSLRIESYSPMQLSCAGVGLAELHAVNKSFVISRTVLNGKAVYHIIGIRTGIKHYITALVTLHELKVMTR